jgi:hypothetical protein
MDEARPLRDVFADLATDEDARRAHAADPEGFLHAHGHAELPSQLVGEAIVNYADTAPPEIAEHLAPFVMAHSPIPVEDGPTAGADPTDGLHLLATAPAEAYPDLLPADLDGSHLDGSHVDAGHVAADQHAGGTPADPFDLDFGHGDQPDDMHHGAASDVDGGHELGGQLGAHQDESHMDGILSGHDAGELLPDHDPAGDLAGTDPGHDAGHDPDQPHGHDAHGWLADGHDLADHPAAPPEDLTDL